MSKPTADELLAAIHKHCLECSGGSRKEMQNCRVNGCSLFPFRQEPARIREKPLDGQVTMFELMEKEAM